MTTAAPPQALYNSQTEYKEVLKQQHTCSTIQATTTMITAKQPPPVFSGQKLEPEGDC